MVILQLDEQPPLIQAVFSGEVEAVKKLLELKQDVNYQDFEKRSALHAAAYRGDAAITEVLIEHGARVNTKDCRWVTPLHRACCSGSEETVSILLKNQADTGARDRLWQTPLHVAAAYNSLECVQYLLERIQNPNVTDRSGRTALHHAVLNGHNDIVELLISKGCIVNACDKKDCRPIHWAAHKGHTETIEILLQNGADINAKDRNQYTPLHVAAASGSVGVIQTLLMHGASIEAQNAYGNAPVHIACLNGHGTCAQELIRHGADREAVNYRGQTPLHIAAASTHGVHCLNMLVALEVNINKQSADGRTALHMTAIHGRFTRSKTLIDNGAVVDSVDKNGCTALHIAAQYGHELLSSTLLTYGANPSKKGYEGRTPLHMCCLSGYIECCRIFIKAGVDLNSRDDLGKTPLHCAAYKGAAECVDLLVSSGSDIKAIDSLGRIPLHYAAAQGFFFCVFTLVGTGSNPNTQDNEGCTALHLASAYDIDGKCVNYLLEHKADPKMRDSKGFTAVHYAVAGNNINALRFLLVTLGAVSLYGADMPPTTPLHIAAKNGNMEILECLMPYFPDPNIRNEDGCTPLLLAARQGYANCVQLLLRFGAKVSICDSVAGLSPVHHSAKNGYVHCLALLVDNAEDKNIINQPDSLHRTALMLGVSNLHVDCVTTLIKSGADPNILDNDGHSCLSRAVVTGQHSVLHMLLPRSIVVNTPDVNGKTILHISAAYGKLACTQRILPYMDVSAARGFDKQNFTALHWACYSSNYECVAHFFKEGIFDTLEGNPFSPVHCAASAGSEKCLELLYKQFGPETVRYKDMKYRTALHVVAIHGHSDCALYLLDHGAEINFKDEDGRTPLMAAAMNGQIQVMEILISYKVDKSIYDNNGNTALHLACLKRHNHAALLLLDFIEDSNVINMINNERKTPLHIAARNGLVDVTRQLIAKGSSVLAVDANGLTPALCCAPNPSVAQCLAIILASHPMQVQGANCKDILQELQTLRLSIKSLIPRPKRGKRRHLQTDITMVRNPDRFELEHMFDVKFDRTEAEMEFKDWMGNVYVKFDNKDSEQFGGPPKKRHKPRSTGFYHGEVTSYSCHELHGSHSDMSLALKTIYSEEDYRKLIKQSVENLKKKQVGVDEIKAKKIEEKIPEAMCSFKYEIADDTDTDVDNVDSYKEVQLPSVVNPNRSPKATNKRLKPQKVKVEEFSEHFERCLICKQFNQDIQDSNPVHEPSIPLEVMKETVNKVLSKKGNSNNRCLYAFLNESFEINSDNAYMIFHGMVSPKCEPFIAKILNLVEGEVEITESAEGEDKLKYWVKKTEQRKLSSTRIKEIKIRSPPRSKTDKCKPREFEITKKPRELEPRSEPSLRSRGAIPKRRDIRKLPVSRNIVKSISYEDKFPRSDTISTKPSDSPILTRKTPGKHLIMTTFVNGNQIDSCGENIAVFERKPSKNQIDAELLDRIPRYLCTLTAFHSYPLFVNQDVSRFFRCYPTYWCVPEVTNKKKQDESSDNENEPDRSLSDTHFLTKSNPDDIEISAIRSESHLKKLQMAERASALEVNDEELLYFNDLVNESLNDSQSSNPPNVDDEEIEQLEAMRRLDTNDVESESKGSCGLKRRAGVTDIQKYPKTVDVWAQLAEEFLKDKMQEIKEEDEGTSQGSKKRKLTINIPRITISDDQMDESEKIGRNLAETRYCDDNTQKRTVEVLEDNQVVQVEKDSKGKELLIYELHGHKDLTEGNRDEVDRDTCDCNNEADSEDNESADHQNDSTKIKTVESIFRNPAKHDSSKKLIDVENSSPSVIKVDDCESMETKSKDSDISEDDPMKIFSVKPDQSDIRLEPESKNATSDNREIIQNIYENLVMQPSSSHSSFQVGKVSPIKNDLETVVKGEDAKLTEEENRLVSSSQSLPVPKIQKDKNDFKKKCRNYSNIYEKGKGIESKVSVDSQKADFKSVPKDLKHITKTQDIQRDSRSKSQESRSPEKKIPKKISDSKLEKIDSINNSKSTLKDMKRGSDSSNKSSDSKSGSSNNSKEGLKIKTDSIVSMEKSQLIKKPNLEHNRYYSPNRRRQIEKPKTKGEIHSQLPVKKKIEPVRSPEKVRSRSVDITTRNGVEQTRSKTMTYESKHAITTSDFIPPKSFQKPFPKEEHKSRKSELQNKQTEMTFPAEKDPEAGSLNDSLIVHPSLQSGVIDLSEFGISDKSAEDDDTIAEIQSIEDDTTPHEKKTVDDSKEEMLCNTILNESSSSFLEKVRHREEEEVAPKVTIYESSVEQDDFICRKKLQGAKIDWELMEPTKNNGAETKLTSKEFWNKKNDLGEKYERKSESLKIEYENEVMNIDDAIQSRAKCGKKVIFSDKVMFMDEEDKKESKSEGITEEEQSKTLTTELDPEIIELSIKLPDVSFAEDIIRQNSEIEYSKPGPSNYNETTNSASGNSSDKRDSPKHFLETIPIEKLIENSCVVKKPESLEKEVPIIESSTEEERTSVRTETKEESDNLKMVEDETESSDVTEMDTSKYFSPPENEVEKKKMMFVSSVEQSSKEPITQISHENLQLLAPIEELSENDTHTTSYEFHDAVDADKTACDEEIEDSDTGNETNFCETDEEKSETANRQQSMETIPEEHSYELSDSVRSGNTRNPGNKNNTYNIYNFLVDQTRVSTSTLGTSGSSFTEDKADTPFTDDCEEVKNDVEISQQINTIESIIAVEECDTNEYIAQIKRIEISEISSVHTYDSLLGNDMPFLPPGSVRIMKITETCESVQKVFDNTEQFNVYKSDFNLAQANFESTGSNTTIKSSSDPIINKNLASTSIASTSSSGSYEPFSEARSAPRAQRERRLLSDIEEDTDEFNNSKAMEDSMEEKTTISVTLDNTDEYSLENKYSKGDNRQNGNGPFNVDKLKNNKVDFIIARSEVTTSIPLDNRTQTYASSEDTNEFVELNDDLQSCNATKKVISDTTLDDEDTMNIEDNLSEDEVRTEDKLLGQTSETDETTFTDFPKKIDQEEDARQEEELGEDSFGHICPRIKLTQHYVEENHSFNQDDWNSSKLITTDDDSGTEAEKKHPNESPSKICSKMKGTTSTEDEECLVSEKDLKQAKSKKSFPSIGKIGKKAKKDSNCKIT